MKNKSTLLILIALLFSVSVYAQHQTVHFGERPPINLDALTPEVFEPGHLRIRVTPATGEHLEQQPVEQLQGLVVFGLDALDAIGQQAGLLHAQQSFDSPMLQNQFTDRHRLWGLHLWYDIYVDESADIIELVRMFEALDEVDVAEPVYRKQLVSGEVFDWDEDAFIGMEDLDEWIPDDPQFGSQWHYKNTGQTNGTAGADIRLHEAWTIEKGNPDVIVAIVDDGIQFTHPDLAANMWEGIGFNFVDNNANIVPGNHGTHVAGTVAAVTNNGVGVAGVAGGSGVGDGVRLMSAQVFRGNASGGFHIAPVWAADNGAAISQNSWGYTAAGIFEQAVLDAIDYFNANGGGDVMEGGITIFAAGNSGDTGDYYPGFYEGAMSVAATNHNDQRSVYSTYGTWVDISAPGGETTASNSQGVLSTVTNSGYAFYQGTSMACPHVSGVAALILSYAPGAFTNDELWDILVSTTDYHYDVNPGFTGQLGSGRLNAYAALNEVNNYLDGLINPSSFSIAATGTDVIELSWTPNPDNDPVLLAYSTDGVFGTPEGSYEAGDDIVGGGHVLLMDNANSFIHSGLEASTTYIYRIWSKKDDNYSSGRMGSAETWCGIFELPFIEEFTTTEMPLCWTTSDWQVGSFSGGLNIDGNYAYSGTGFGGPKNVSMISPIIDMSNFEDVTISFQHYFRSFFLGGNSAAFAYSLDNGQSWTNVQTWSNSTANPASFQVSIPELARQPMVLFRWSKSIGLFGYYWTVGNIDITGTMTTPSDQYTVTFSVENTAGTPIGDAVITFDGTEYNPGNYLFESIPADTYNYSVSQVCYNDYHGTVVITDDDKHVLVVLDNLPGDANDDSVVNVLDVIAVTTLFIGEDVDLFCFHNADVNGDGEINVLDAIEIVQIFLQNTQDTNRN